LLAEGRSSCVRDLQLVRQIVGSATMTMQVLRYVAELLTERLQEDASKIKFIWKLLQYFVLIGRICIWITSPWVVGRERKFCAG
jgi:hypothetical protein